MGAYGEKLSIYWLKGFKFQLSTSEHTPHKERQCFSVRILPDCHTTDSAVGGTVIQNKESLDKETVTFWFIMHRISMM
jgi:hypothetical protein